MDNKPPESPDYTYEAITRNDNQRTKKPLWFSLVAIVLVGLGGYLAYMFLSQGNTAVEIPAATSSPQKPGGVSEKGVAAEALLQYANETLRGTGVDYGKTVPNYAVTDFKYSTSLGGKLARTVSVERDAGEAQVAFSALKDLLKSKNLVEEVIQADDSKVSVAESGFVGSRSICSVTLTKPLSPTEKHTVAASCVEKSEFEKTAKAQQPFYNAFMRDQVKEAETEKLLLVGNPEIKDSNVLGYKIARLGISSTTTAGQSTGLFYKTPDSDWKYFQSTRELVLCSKYDSVDLQRAYYRQDCAASELQSDVRKVEI